MIFNPGLVPQAGSGGGAVTMEYIGTGAAGKTLELPIEPAIVVITALSSSYGTILMFCPLSPRNWGGFGIRNYNNSSSNSQTVCILGTLSEKTLTITNTTSSLINYYNNNGITYNVTIIPKA